jgi:cellobiose phosphorylase
MGLILFHLYKKTGYEQGEMKMEHKYGYFNEDGTEFIVTDPAAPRAFDNFLWNDAIFSNVQHTGVGYCDYQVGTNEAVQLLTGVGRICDFDVFGRDHLMSRLIYIRDNETGEYWNVNWEPVQKPCEKYECVHGLGYTILNTTVNGICCSFRIFVPKGKDPVELWSLKIIDTTGKNRSLSVFVYNQFQFKYKWGYDSYGDMIFRGAWFNKEMNAAVACKHPHRKPHDYLTGFITADETITAFDGSRNAFAGTYNTLEKPQAVINGRCTNTPGSSDATIGAIQFDVLLSARGSKEISLILGATNDEKNIGGFREKYFGRFETFFTELKEEKKALVSRNRVQTPDVHLNRMMNGWIKQGTLYGAMWCRWGWNGYRDIVQHGLGVASFLPHRTRVILLEALQYQYKSGLALRGWNPVDEKPYSDSALWLVFTLAAYLKESGDFDLLGVNVPYYDGGSASVQEHIEQALSFLENNKGAHGLCLIKFGDWNDSLTAVGKDGKGESVWLSEAYAEAMLQMADLAGHQKDERKKQDFLARYERIKEAINKNAWDGNWYVRCFDDNGRPVGSKENEQGQIFFEAQTWALISGVADSERISEVIAACDDKLHTELGYALLAPTFTRRDDHIGRISCLEPGVCENGTIYSHVNAWMILGLLRNHRPDKAFETLQKIMPGYIRGENDPKQSCPPYMFSNCYYGADHRNNSLQMEFTWITGSLAWYNHLLLNDLLGARAEFGGLRIDPCIPSEWEQCEVERNYRGTVYHIVIKNPEHVGHGKAKVIVDGEAIEGNLVPLLSADRVHEIEVTIVA